MSAFSTVNRIEQTDFPILYVEIGALLAKNLTGIGRFIIRLLEALSPHCQLRLVNLVEPRLATHMRLSRALPSRQEIPIPRGSLPTADSDLKGWLRRTIKRPRGPVKTHLLEDSPLLFTSLRPPQRHSQMEWGIVYDFSPVLLPWTQLEKTRHYFMDYYARTAALCDRVLTISHSTSRDARWLSTIPADRIETVHPGPSLCLDNHASPYPAPRRQDMILVVSTLEPRKNGRFVLDWFFETSALDPGMKLYWVGPGGWLRRQPETTGRGKFPQRRAEFLGVVSDQNLCELYRQATFSIYPSLYEGFGFPVLDSLRHQTPVVCGFHSSLEEFAGPGVYYFDPCDPSSLDEACALTLGRIDAGFRRGDLDAKYSWSKLALRLMSSCN
jgi:glycosyltransferase involved in cell wall biosynthesis